MNAYEACINEYAENGPNALWEATRAVVEGRDHTRKIYVTGYDGACAFDNAAPYAPVSILVCPTKKPYLNIEHFVMEEGAEAVGQFMQAAVKVAREAVLVFDMSLTNEALAKRTYYESELEKFEAQAELDTEALAALTRAYVRDSKTYSFALRDRHTGHSGYRIAFNNGTGATGMSQPHMHAQIVAGRYLGGIAVPDPIAVYPEWAFTKVAHSLIHRTIKARNS